MQSALDVWQLVELKNNLGYPDLMFLSVSTVSSKKVYFSGAKSHRKSTPALF